MKEISFQYDILPLKNVFFRTAMRITLDAAEAEDIVQETLIRIWNKRDEWSQITSLEAYGLTICRNLALDKVQKQEWQNLSLDDSIRVEPEMHTPLDRLEQKERMRLVQQIFKGLPEKQGQIVEMRELDGMSYKEIAQKLELSEEQVKVHLFRARQKIKKQIIELDKYGL